MTSVPDNGKRLALKATEIHKNARKMEKVFLDGYRKRVEALGFRTVNKGPFWDVAGISDKTIRKFSERRGQIEHLYSTVQKVTPALRQKAGIMTRKEKARVIDLDALRKEWRSRLTGKEKDVFLRSQVKPKIGRGLARRKAYVAGLRFREQNMSDMNRDLNHARTPLER